MKRRGVMAGMMAAVAMLAQAGHAQPRFPEKPLQIIAPYAPGGAADVLSRMIARELEAKLGQAVIVVNKPGAGTIIGAQALMAAPADGYTLLLTSNSTFTLNPAVMESLPYDPAKDFEPVAQLATIGLALITYADHPVRDVAGLVAAARAEPGKLVLASFGNATVSHFAGEWFKSVAGLSMVHVPYRGSGPAMTDLVGKHVPFLVDTIVATKPQMEAGKVRPLAVASAKRSAMLPDVPTLQELGFAGINLSSWVALVAAKGIPGEAKAKISAAVADILRDPAALAQMQKAGFEPAYEVYADWPGMVTKEIAGMKAIAQKAGIKAD